MLKPFWVVPISQAFGYPIDEDYMHGGVEMRHSTINLFWIILALGLSAYLWAAYTPSGGLSPDSCSYLGLAQNLLEGKGFTTAPLSQDSTALRERFATWPVGYPTLIYLFSWIFGANVFWSSKLVNLVAATGCLILLRFTFGAKAWVYALSFLTGTMVLFCCYSNSEMVFIFGLLWFSLALAAAWRKATALNLASLLAAGLFTFLIRYIGFFSFGLIGLSALVLFWKKRRIDAVFFMSIAFLGVILAGAYLYSNLEATGFLTGRPRLPSPESNFTILLMILKAAIREINLVLPLTGGGTFIFGKSRTFWFLLSLLVEFALVGYCLIKGSIWKKIRPSKMDTTAYFFILAAATYLISLVALRWTRYFDDFTFRMVGPGFILLLFAGINYLLNMPSGQVVARGKTFFTVLMVFSLILSGFLPAVSGKGKPLYSDTIEKISHKYKTMPPNSAVAFGSQHLLYLRTDLRIIKPCFQPQYSEKETWEAFMQRFKKLPFPHLFIVSPDEPLTPDYFHPSVYAWLRENKDRLPMQIR